MDADGLANFLANHPDVKGIGPAKARLIADHFGVGFDAAIRTQPEAVAAVAKAPLESILALQRIWIANSDFNAAMTYLSGFGFRCCRMAEWTCSEPSTGSPRTSTAAAGLACSGRLASAPRSRRPRWILLQTWAASTSGAPRDPNRALVMVRARKLLADAKKAERAERRQAGELIEVATIREYANQFSALVKDHALAQADRLASTLAALTDVAQVHRLIREDNNRMLDKLARAIRDLPQAS